MSNYTNDTNDVSHSHNIYKNRSNKDLSKTDQKTSSCSSNNGIRRSSGVNINTFKADSYNWLMGVVAILCILFSLSAVGASLYINKQTLKELETFKNETKNNFVLLQEVFSKY